MPKHFRVLMASAVSFSLVASHVVITPAFAQTAPAAEAPGDAGWQKEFEQWRAASKSGKPADYSAYLKSYPRGKFANVAKQRIEELNGTVADAKPILTTPIETKTVDTKTAETKIADTKVAEEADPADNAEAKVIDNAKVASTVRVSEADAGDIELWRAVSKTGKQADYERYLKEFPKGKFAKVAKTRIDNMVAKVTEPAVTEPATDTAAADDQETAKPVDQADNSANQTDEAETADNQTDPSPAVDDQAQQADNAATQTDEVQSDDQNTADATAKPKAGEWEQEYALWKAASDGNTVVEYESYLKQYPQGKFAAIAQARIVQLAAAEAPVADVAEGDDQQNDTKPANDAVANKQDSVKPDQKVAEVDPALSNDDNGGQVAGENKMVRLTEGSPDIEDGLLDRDARHEIQGRLSSLGYNTRGTDGDFGQNSRRAIGDWQSDNRAPVNGYLSEDQVALITQQSRSSYKNWLKQQVAASQRVRPRRDRVVVEEAGPGDDVVIIERVRPRRKIIVEERRNHALDAAIAVGVLGAVIGTSRLGVKRCKRLRRC